VRLRSSSQQRCRLGAVEQEVSDRRVGLPGVLGGDDRLEEMPVAMLTTTGSGLVVMRVGTTDVTFTPEQAEQFAFQMLRRARPGQIIFMVPVEG
jgi:hypothetical protein